jgi:hypothetical protein
VTILTATGILVSELLVLHCNIPYYYSSSSYYYYYFLFCEVCNPTEASCIQQFVIQLNIQFFTHNRLSLWTSIPIFNFPKALTLPSRSTFPAFYFPKPTTLFWIQQRVRTLYNKEAMFPGTTNVSVTSGNSPLSIGPDYSNPKVSTVYYFSFFVLHDSTCNLIPLRSLTGLT